MLPVLPINVSLSVKPVAISVNLGGEVRLTLIATGFTDKETLIGAGQEKEITRVLKNLKTEEELAVPAFLRQRRVLSGGH